MSFLAHLATRGLERREAVQPRLPSLFEPPPSAPVFGDLAAMPARTEEERPVERWEAPPETPRRRAPAPPPPAFLTPREEPAQPAPPARRQPAAPPVEPARPEPALFPRPEARPDRTVVAAPLPAVERPALPASPAPPPRALAPAAPPRPEPAARIETREVRFETAPARPDPPPPVTPPPPPSPVLARPEIAGIVAPRQERPAERFAAPEPAPVIRVTIGRIEVRAAVPSAAAAAAAAPARPESRRGTEPSLEEYLKRRSGEGMK